MKKALFPIVCFALFLSCTKKQEAPPPQPAVENLLLITHTLPLSDGVRGYDIFTRRTDNAIKVVLKP